ncbi:MAG: DUF5777 family beta-barrel protein, partial [Verrucomicrobiota bacterium]
MAASRRRILNSTACTLALMLPAQVALADGHATGTYDWSGNYVGLGLDIANTGVAWSTDYGGNYGGETDAAPVLTFGRNWQDGNVVYGIEGNIVWPGYEGQTEVDTPDNYIGYYDWKWSASIRGRAGIASGNLLTYAIAGVTVAELELEGCESLTRSESCAVERFTIHAEEVEVGFNAGIGVEYAVSPRSSVRAEYLYTVFPSIFTTTNESGAFTEPGDLSTDAHTLRLSWNYMLGEERGMATSEALQATSHSWAGTYVGGFVVGGMIVDDVLNPNYESNRAYNWAGGGGVAVGHDWQKGNFVYGVVADIAGGQLESSSYWGDDYRKEQDWDWLAT